MGPDRTLPKTEIVRSCQKQYQKAKTILVCFPPEATWALECVCFAPPDPFVSHLPEPAWAKARSPGGLATSANKRPDLPPRHLLDTTSSKASQSLIPWPFLGFSKRVVSNFGSERSRRRSFKAHLVLKSSIWTAKRTRS